MIKGIVTVHAFSSLYNINSCLLLISWFVTIITLLLVDRFLSILGVKLDATKIKSYYTHALAFIQL